MGSLLRNHRVLLGLALVASQFGRPVELAGGASGELRLELCEQQLEQALRLHHQQQYSQAAEQARLLLKRCPDEAAARLLLGRCLLDLGRAEAAATELEALCKQRPDHREGLQLWALALSRAGRFGEAAEVCRLVLADPGLSPGERDRVAEALENHVVRDRLSRRDQPRDARWSLGLQVNSPCNDSMPVLSIDGQRLFFTSNRAGGQDDCTQGACCREDFWTSDLGHRSWGPSRNPGGPFNTRLSEGSGSFTATGTTLYLAACDREGGYGDCDLYRMSRTASGWGPARNLGAQVNSPWWDSHPAVSASGDLLVFSSNRPGGLGDSDLWACRWLDGAWSEPYNLGTPINTSGREETPFLHAGGQALYYCSSGHPGFGDLDLFFSRLDGEHWAPPLNLGRPINGPGPDLGLTVAGEGKQGIYSSQAPGREDLDLFGCLMPTDCRPDQARLLRGQVLAADGSPLMARVRADGLLSSIEIPLQWTAPDGRFGLVLPAGPLLVSASAPGYFFASRLLEHGESWSDSLLTLALQPIRVGARAVVENLYFDFDRATLQEISRPVLESTRDLLGENPGLRLELQGHTDAVGSDAYNLDLSRRRAESVRSWLLEHGIDPGRLEARGYGETVPVASNDNDPGRALNRRTEILVLDF